MHFEYFNINGTHYKFAHLAQWSESDARSGHAERLFQDEEGQLYVRVYDWDLAPDGPKKNVELIKVNEADLSKGGAYPDLGRAWREEREKSMGMRRLV